VIRAPHPAPSPRAVIPNSPHIRQRTRGHHGQRRCVPPARLQRGKRATGFCHDRHNVRQPGCSGGMSRGCMAALVVHECCVCSNPQPSRSCHSSRPGATGVGGRLHLSSSSFSASDAVPGDLGCGLDLPKRFAFGETLHALEIWRSALGLIAALSLPDFLSYPPLFAHSPAPLCLISDSICARSQLTTCHAPGCHLSLGDRCRLPRNRLLPQVAPTPRPWWRQLWL
jgi:hypothetical protein